MSKKILIIIVIIISLSTNVYADEITISEITEIITEDFDFENQNEYIDSEILYQITGYTTLKDMLSGIINGDFRLNIKDLFNNILDIVKKNFNSNIHMIISVSIISIIYSILTNTESAYLEKEIEKITFCAVYISMITILIKFTFESIRSSATIINNLITFINQFTPVFFLLITTTGGVLTSSVIYPIMLFYTSFINAVICNLVIPISSYGYILSLCSKVINTIDFSYLTNFIKKFTYFILGASFTVFGIIVSFEGITFASIDSLRFGTVKYTVSSVIPVIGKFIADSADVINGFLNIIKNSLGLLGTIAVITIMIIPSLKIFTMYLSIRICSIVIQPFADKRISEALDNTAQYIFFICICVIFTTIMLIVIIGLLLIFANNIFK